MLISAFIFIIIAALCFWGLSPKYVNSGTGSRQIGPKSFVIILLLYCIPLPLAVILGSEGGDISENLETFSSWLPESLFFTSLFLITFTLVFRYLDRGKAYQTTFRLPSLLEKKKFVFLWIFLFLLSIFLLQWLAKDVGGIFSLVLSGYRVTELLVGQGHFAIAFEWLVALIILLMCYSIAAKSRSLLCVSICLAAIEIAMLAIMGRRAMLVVVMFTLSYVAIEAGWIKKPKKLLLPGLVLFLVLNWLGLVRGESYSDLSQLFGVLIEKTASLAEAEELLVGLFYTLTHGNFVVPFETLPQIISHLDRTQDYWLGSTVPRSLLLLIPNFLVPERPLPLANWYMSEFYGGAPLNEGRQFFFLGEAYLNFGWFGAVIWGSMTASFWHLFSRPQKGEIRYWNLALRALFFGSALNFVASDTTGFFVGFFKGFGLIPLLFAFVEYAKLLKQKNI